MNFLMESEIILSVIALVSSIATGLIGYANGKRKRENEADKSAYEAYNFALESLRKEFEARIERMQNDYNHIQANFHSVRFGFFEIKHTFAKTYNQICYEDDQETY